MTPSWTFLFLAAALVAGLVAVSLGLGAARYRGHGRGTPGYARARTARRSAVHAVLVALLMLAAAVSFLARSGPIIALEG